MKAEMHPFRSFADPRIWGSGAVLINDSTALRTRRLCVLKDDCRSGLYGTLDTDEIIESWYTVGSPGGKKRRVLSCLNRTGSVPRGFISRDEMRESRL